MKRLSLRRWAAGVLVAAGLLAFVSLLVVPRLMRMLPPYLLRPHANPDRSPWILLRSTPVVSLGVFSAWLVVLVAGAGWLLGAWVITPLLGLRQAAQRLAREEWDLALPSSRIRYRT